jgi:putative ABC transport system ATP-binding protein
MLVEVNDLTRTYMMGATAVNALRGVSFAIERGEFVAIMGPSGSGKSTLMHLLGCLDQPTSGSYLLDGTPMENLSDQELSHLRNHKVGFVFQAFNLIAQLTILENVEVPLIYKGMDRVRRQSLCLDMLKTVGLAHRARHRPNELPAVRINVSPLRAHWSPIPMSFWLMSRPAILTRKPATRSWKFCKS